MASSVEGDRHEGPEEGEVVEQLERIRRENVQLRAEMAKLLSTFERVLRHLIEVHTTLLRVVDVMRVSSDDEQAKQVAEGFRLLAQNLQRALESEGVKIIESVGKTFDPKLHEAVGYIETEDLEEGTVVAEIERGFTLNDTVLRPSKVLIAKRPRKATEPSAEVTP
ncbi:MAG: nucleotide exchange factor GrpE [Thaumarchaeota archaeon]|nr:nucleotide exchange factor GrpE [Candidatus Calditenuaceae archaeon]MDW8186951.1 nucleotide exchange factor GrpE [Nitrososphaerota archaeon]